MANYNLLSRAETRRRRDAQAQRQPGARTRTLVLTAASAQHHKRRAGYCVFKCIPFMAIGECQSQTGYVTGAMMDKIRSIPRRL